MDDEKLTIIAKIVAKTNKRNLVKSELLRLVDPTRNEKGNLNYDLHQDVNNPDLFLMYENWKSREL